MEFNSCDARSEQAQPQRQAGQLARLHASAGDPNRNYPRDPMTKEDRESTIGREIAIYERNVNQLSDALSRHIARITPVTNLPGQPSPPAGAAAPSPRADSQIAGALQDLNHRFYALVSGLETVTNSIDL